MAIPPRGSRTTGSETRLSRFIPSPTRDTLVVVGPSKQGPAFVPEHVATRAAAAGPFNTLEGVFGATEDNIHGYAFQSATNWLENKNQACFIRTLGFGNTGVRLNQEGNLNNGIVEGSGFVVGDLLKSGSVTPGQVSKNKYAFYEDGADGISGRTYFLGSLYRVKNSLSGLAKNTISRRIVNVYDSIPGDKSFKIIGEETSYSYMPIVNAVLMTAHGIVPTLSLRKDINNDFFNRADDDISKYLFSNRQPDGEIRHDDFDLTNRFARGQFVTDTVGTDTYEDSDQGYYFGSYIKDGVDDHRFYELILNGYNEDLSQTDFEVSESKIPHKRIIKFSLDPTNELYLFGNIKVNRDPSKIQEYGYCFYTMFDVKNNFGRCLQPYDFNTDNPGEGTLTAFIVPGYFDRNTASTATPNWENFRDKYKRAESPWIISQTKNINANDKSDLSSAHNLFKVKSLYEGEVGNNIQFNILLKSPPEITSSNEELYSTFDLQVLKYNTNTRQFELKETFADLTLNVKDDNFIGYKIGTQSTYYDFKSNNIVSEGSYIQNSKYIFIELSDYVSDGLAKYNDIPCGYKGLPHLNISPVNTEFTYPVREGSYDGVGIVGFDTTGTRFLLDSTSTLSNKIVENFIVPPVPLVANPQYEDAESFTIRNNGIVWGINNNQIDSEVSSLTNAVVSIKSQTEDLSKDNFNDNIKLLRYSENINPFILEYSKYFFNEYENAKNCLSSNVLKQCDFSFERILVQDKEEDDDSTSVVWNYSRYIDDGLDIGYLRDNEHERYLLESNFYRYLDINSDFKEGNEKYLQFKCGLFGGFDGLNIFDRDEYNMTPDGLTREYYLNDETVNKPLHNAFNKAFDISFNRDDMVIKDIISTSGITSPTIQKKWSRKAEDAKEFLFARDIPFVDAGSLIATGSIIHEVIDDESVISTTQNTTFIDSINSVRGASFKEGNLNIDSSYVSDFYGYCEGLYNEEPIVLSPTSIAASSLSKTDLSKSPALSVALEADEIISFDSLIDNKFSASDENYLNNKELFQNKKINVFKLESTDGTTEFSLADGKTNFDLSDSNLKSIGFRRTLLRLRKNIKNAVLREVLFESNDSNRITARKYQLFSDNEVSKFLNAGYISSGKVEIPQEISQEDLENYVLRAKTTVSFNSIITNSSSEE